jgi:Ca2+-binding EF-hand superfamily protein
MYSAKLTSSLLTLVLSAGVTPCLAAPDMTPSDQSAIMAKIDVDHDGTISMAEAKAAAAAKFDALDTDKEETLDASELIGIVGSGTLAGADKDKDHTLDKAEFIALVDKMFASADADRDGTLTPQELSTEKGRALVALFAY